MYTSLYMKDARDFSQDLEADGKFNGSVFHRYFAPSADIAEINNLLQEVPCLFKCKSAPG